MMYKIMGYIECIYRIKPASKAIGEALAAEQSTGTWVKVAGEREKLRAWVKKVDPPYIHVVFPADLFEQKNIPQLLATVAGNLFGLGSIEHVRLEDIIFSGNTDMDLGMGYKGPKFGIECLRKMVGTLENRRPHIGTIIKPNVGLSPKETAELAYEVASGGVDFIKDDEILVNQTFCPISERVPAVMEVLDRVKEETGRKVLYAVNVTSNDILTRAQAAVDSGARVLMVDAITSGLSSIELLSSNFNFPIHVHRAMHAAITRNPLHGISMGVIAKIVRLAGGDQLHIGTTTGKMAHDDVRAYKNILTEGQNIKAVFPVLSGGLHPGGVAAEIDALGKDIVLQAGGGIHGHPSGPRAGAMAMKQAVDAYMEGISSREYAKDHKELMAALDLWGRTDT